MPHTTLESSSCAMTQPPAATMSAAPRVPSEPMPVRTRARFHCPRFGSGRKHGIDGRLAKIDLRAVIERDRRHAIATNHPQMPAARRDVDRTGAQRLSVHRFVHRPAAGALENLGQDGGEGGRHVLGDQNRSLVDDAGDAAHDGPKRLGSAGRGADQQNARRRRRQGSQLEGDGVGCRSGVGTGDMAQASAGRGRANRRRARARRPRRKRAGGVGALLATAPKGANFLDEVATKRGRGGDLAGRFRLRNVVGSAERQRAQAHLCVAPGERRGHDHDEIVLLLEEVRQGRDPVDVRHVDIENDDIGIGPLHLLDGFAAAAQRGHDLQSDLGLDPAHQEAAHDDGIVDDHHPDRIMSGRISQMQAGVGDAHRGTQHSS